METTAWVKHGVLWNFANGENNDDALWWFGSGSQHAQWVEPDSGKEKGNICSTFAYASFLLSNFIHVI